MNKPQLEKQEVYLMDYGVLEKLIKLHFGFEYNYVSDEESNNGEHKLYSDVDGNSFGIWEKEEFNTWLELKGRGEGFHAEALLNSLITKGVLEPGNYLIETFW
jgi:hypothetical protein